MECRLVCSYPGVSEKATERTTCSPHNKQPCTRKSAWTDFRFQAFSRLHVTRAGYFFVPNDYLIRLGVLLLLLLISFFVVHYSLSFFEEEDPQSIVIDEVLGMSISLFFIGENFLLSSI